MQPTRHEQALIKLPNRLTAVKQVLGILWKPDSEWNKMTNLVSRMYSKNGRKHPDIEGSTVRFYSQTVFPALCDLFMRQPALSKERLGLLRNAWGEILEIGFGTGLNLAHYPKAVRRITAVDPNVGMHAKAKRRIARARIDVVHFVLSSERLPFEDGTFDCVVSTWTLCSIQDVKQALREVHRVLRTGGRFLFLEHGQSPEPGVQKWQRRLNWLQMRLADGCRLDRNIKELVSAQPYASLEMSEYYLGDQPRTHGYMYRGVATK